MKSPGEIQHVSDTAFWVATYRAMESERKDPLFYDPLAKLLIGEKGKDISRNMKSISRYAHWSLVIRTRLIDDYLLKYIGEGCKTVINLGAGLDTRPYRLNLPQELHWIEVDFPSVIQFKNEKLKNEQAKCHLERIELDLSNRLERQKLFRELNSRVSSAILLTEGVIPYLSEQMVSELAADLSSQSNFKLWIAEYYSPEIYPRFQSQSFTKLLGNSPFQFFPKDWFSLFRDSGWLKKELRYLYDEGEKLNRNFPLPLWASLIRTVMEKLKVDPEKFAKHIRLQGYVILEKA